MDPISATVLAGLLWFFFGGLGSVVIYFISTFIALVLSGAKTQESAALSLVAGWVCASLWSFFVLYQVIIHIVHLIQLVFGV